MKQYFLVLAACVFLASVMCVPEVYAQLGSSTDGASTQTTDKNAAQCRHDPRLDR